MKPAVSSNSLLKRIIERNRPLLNENGRIIVQFILALFFLGLAIWFFKHEKAELRDVKVLLITSRWQVILIGTCLAGTYVLLQGLMYKAALASLGAGASLRSTIILFLKRNFISVFLPAGGVSSLVFFTGDIVKQGVSKSQIQLASSIYAFTGILSVVLIAVPAFLFAILEKNVNQGELYALAFIIFLVVILYLMFRSARRKGVVSRLLARYIPESEVFLADLQNGKIDRPRFLYCLLASVFIEIVGIILVYLAMLALNIRPRFDTAIMAYVSSVVMMAASPFMRGLGAVEFSMSFVLVRLGLTNVEAIAVTLLYRFFEFWLILLLGLASFLLKINKLLMRIIPSLLILLLGVVNILSVLTPAISSRLEWLRDFLPMEAISASNYLVLMAGLFMLVTAAFILKGLRSAWWFALVLSSLSVIGHLTKAIDYEEAIAALIVVTLLLLTHREYYIKTDPKLKSVGFRTALLALLAVLIYGTVGFYFLDKKHFGIDFSFWQSVGFTMKNFFLLNDDALNPADPFASHFLASIKICGVCSLAFLVYAMIQPYAFKFNREEEDMLLAQNLLQRFGKSSLDYFKISPEKQYFFTSDRQSFIAYRFAGNYAVVLEDPVAENPTRVVKAIQSFDEYCYDNGFKSIFYRVPEESLDIYKSLGKKSLFLGQEAVINLDTFSLEGKERKDLRHAVNKVKDMGYSPTIHPPPIKDGILQKLKAVSDEWLSNTGRTEIIFSQGKFDWDQLKQQTILTVENPEEKVVAFLNIIPDYAPYEGTYDLLRKTADAANRTSEFLVIRLCEYLKSQGYRYLNLGFAPLSGIANPQSFPEKSLSFAYEKIRSFSHYKGLREFKERFIPDWHNIYLIYDHDFDLIRVPGILARIIKP